MTTINYGKNNQSIELLSVDADWNWNDLAALVGYNGRGGLPVQSIQFKPAAGDDQCVIRDGSSSGATIFD
jgi:hypothetical protein